MRRLLTRFEGFFFSRESALGMGMMRAGFGAVVLLSMGTRIGDALRYFSDTGLWPEPIGESFLRLQRFTLLDAFTGPVEVSVVYGLLIAFAFSTMIGLLPRFSTIVTYVLLVSFHERAYAPLAGGDTVIRAIGFLVMISPGIQAFSVRRIPAQWAHWKTYRRLLPQVTMPHWPRLLVLWQLIVIYVTSGWFKLLGNNWIAGTAAAFPYHHAHFARFNSAVFDAIPYFYPAITYATLMWEMLWLFFLLPPILTSRIPFLRNGGFRRFMLLGGIVFHGMILATLAVGTFSYAMFTLYLGMLREEDFAALRKRFGGRKDKVTMLYDGQCNFCVRSAFVLRIFDAFHRIRFANMRDADVRKAYAPAIKLAELDRVVHVRLRNGTVVNGYRAIRVLLKQLPIFWIVVPLLYIPGMTFIGDPAYEFIAKRRRRCIDGSCET